MEILKEKSKHMTPAIDPKQGRRGDGRRRRRWRRQATGVDAGGDGRRWKRQAMGGDGRRRGWRREATATLEATGGDSDAGGDVGGDGRRREAM